MPHKVKYGLDYDDSYDDDYDYYEGYEYEDTHEENGKVDVVKEEKVQAGVWRCSICTYDNDESMTYCDICGVLRVPPDTRHNTGKRTVEGKSEASLLAKSLFASLPRGAPGKDRIFQSGSDHLVGVEGSQKSHGVAKITGEPFKFDGPSPDDMVSSGLRSLRATPRVAMPTIDSGAKDFEMYSDAGGAENPVNFKQTMDGSKAKNGAPVNSSSSNGKDSSIKVASSAKRSDDPAMILKARHDTASDASTPENGGKGAVLTSNLENLSLSVNSRTSKHVTCASASSQAQYKPEKWMLPKEGEAAMTQLNLAIVGHVDSGKSTLSGRLLHLLGTISQKEMHKYESLAKMQGKGSFAYAWALDQSFEERERGITMNVAVAYFDTKRYHVVVLDSPGHKDFVPNMISGATQADAAILVVDASLGSFESGMDATWGQTREHAQLIRSFGVDQLIIAINKMDSVDYSKERFELIKRQVGSFLRSCGFKDPMLSWVPVSAMENQNLVASASNSRLKSWYQGPNLLEAMDAFHPPTREYSKPLVMPICDVIRSHSMGQVSACGKLETGAVRNGSKVLVMPLGEVATVRTIESNGQPLPVARAGDSVAISLQGIDVGHVSAGGVLCHPDFPVKVAAHLELKVLVLYVITPLLIGSQLEFYIHHAKEVATVVKIVSLLDPKTGKVAKKAPRCLVAKQSAVIEVVLQGAVCVDEFSNCKALGRVFLRASGRTVAVGVVARVLEVE
ncbi:HBS1-like protein [Drosera capensis]